MGALTIWGYIRCQGCDAIGRICLVDQSPKLITCDEWQHGIYGEFNDSHNEEFITRLENDFAEAVLRLAGDGKNPLSNQMYIDNSVEFQKVRDYLCKLDPKPLLNVWKSLSLVDYREVLPKISLPTLLVHGDESQFYSVELAEFVHKSIPGAQLHFYKGTHHSPHLWQRLRFIQDLQDFARA
jgi:pimeloyl-ACP methyl ester carboxylesterase